MIIPIFSKTIFLRYTLIEWDTWWVNYNSPENWRRFNSQGCWNLIGDHNATSWPLMTFNFIQSIFFTLSQGLHSSFWGFKWFMWAEKGKMGGHRCRSFLHARLYRTQSLSVRRRWVIADRKSAIRPHNFYAPDPWLVFNFRRSHDTSTLTLHRI